MSNNNVIYDHRIPKIKPPVQRKKTNKRFLIFLCLFFLTILCILYIQSPLSKLEHIEVDGHYILSEEEIVRLSKVQLGMFIFNFDPQKVEERLTQITEIKTAIVHRKFPNKLLIEVKEHSVIAYWLDDNKFFPVLSSGHILKNREWSNRPVNQPIFNQWPHKEGVVELSNELSKLHSSITTKISEIVLYPTISDPYRLRIFMSDGYEVRSTIRNFSENMSWYPHFVQQLQAEEKTEGVINLFEGKWYEDPSQLKESEQDSVTPGGES